MAYVALVVAVVAMVSLVDTHTSSGSLSFAVACVRAPLCMCVAVIWSSLGRHREFLRPLMRSQAFMNFCEDAGVAGELMRLHNRQTEIVRSHVLWCDKLQASAVVA